MIKFTKLHKEEKHNVYLQTSTALDMPTQFIEKDFWVCLVLYILFDECSYKDYLIFGGGTSLSKAYHCINRFSEDIDIAINWEILGFTANPIEGKSKAQRKITVENIRNSTFDFIKSKLYPDLKNKINSILGDEFNVYIKPDCPDSIFIKYQKIFSYKYVQPVVKIEIGSVSSEFLRISKVVNPYIDEAFPNSLEIHNIKVPTTLISRIFWDKAMVLHRIAYMPEDKKTPYRYARHYYDLYCLAKDGNIKQNAIKDTNILKLAVDENTEFYRCNWAHYDDCLNR